MRSTKAISSNCNPPRHRQVALLGLSILLLWTLLTPNLATALYGLGGLLSEKVIGSPLVNSRLTVGPAGAQLQSVAMGPAINTLSPINIGMDTAPYATLRGEVLNLNIDSGVTVWFEWGYSPNLGFTSVTQAASSTGLFSIVLRGYEANERVYYRFVAQGGDGTNHGPTHNFVLTGTALWAIANVLPTAILIVLLVSLFTIGINLNP